MSKAEPKCINRRHVVGGGSGLLIASLLGAPAARAEGTFRIGSLNSVTGAAGAFGSGVQKMVLQMVKEINAAGGPAGMSFEVFAEDSQTLPEPALLAAKKLIEVNKVRALVGVQTSPETLAVQPAANAADVLLFHSGAAPKIFLQNTKSLAFGFWPSSVWYGRAYFNIVEKEKFKNPASLILTNDASIANARSFAESWQGKNGKPPASVQYQPSQPSYRSEIQQIMSSNPDVILVHGYEPDATIIIRQLFELGYAGKIISPDFAITSRLITAVGKEPVEGAYVLRFLTNKNGPTYKPFLEVAGRVGGDIANNPYSAIAYDEMSILALAIEKAGAGASNAQIAAAVLEVSNPEAPIVSSFVQGRELLRSGAKRLNYDGASGPCDFDATGTTPARFGVSIVKAGVPQEPVDVTAK